MADLNFEQTRVLTKPLPRGGIPSPRFELAAAKPHIPDINIAVPTSFLMWPPQLSYWGNGRYDDCVSAEEAFAKATAAPHVIIPETTVITWAAAHNYLNGAYLVDVMRTLQKNGFALDSEVNDDGAFNSVNWTDSNVMQSAIYSNGPVKLGVASGKFESNLNGKVTAGRSGWCMYNYPGNLGQDHCIGVCGYGRLMDLIVLFQQHGVSVAVPAGMPESLCYAVFTWNSIGVIDEQSMRNMTQEAWIRTPVTIVRPVPNVYLTTQGSDGIWGFSLSLPSRPIQLLTSAGLGFSGVISIGNILCLTTHGSDGIYEFDRLSQDRPSQISTTAGLGFTGLIQVGNSIYLTTQGSDGIYEFDLTTRARPQQIGSTAGLGFTGILAVGNMLYLTTHGSDGIYEFDLATRARPKQMPSTSGLGFTGMIQVGDLLYLTTHGSDGIWEFAFLAGARPGKIASTAGLGFTGIIQAGNILYLTTHGSDGIWTFNLTTRARPTEIASTAGLGFVGIVAV